MKYVLFLFILSIGGSMQHPKPPMQRVFQAYAIGDSHSYKPCDITIAVGSGFVQIGAERYPFQTFIYPSDRILNQSPTVFDGRAHIVLAVAGDIWQCVVNSGGNTITYRMHLISNQNQ